MNHLILTRWPDLERVNKKKKTCGLEDFALPADHGRKLKESQKKDKYLNISWKRKNLWNIKVTDVSIEIGALGIIKKGLGVDLQYLE